MEESILLRNDSVWNEKVKEIVVEKTGFVKT
jgi:hypothetical protein